MSKEVGSTLRETLLKSDLPAVIEEAGEIGIDTLIEDGVLKKLPILSTITALGKTYGTIRDYIFTKKLMRFLQSISSLNESQRVGLIEKLDKDPGFGAYAGERLIDLLSRLDDENKPLLVAKALKLYAKGEISSSQLQRINYAIDRFLLCDIEELKIFCSANAVHRGTDGDPVTANFINAGLAYVQSGYGGGGVHPTETAKILIAVINEE